MESEVVVRQVWRTFNYEQLRAALRVDQLGDKFFGVDDGTRLVLVALEARRSLAV